MKRIYRIGDEPMKERKGKGLFVFCCLAPAAILFILFMIVPTIEIFRISLYKWGGYTDNKTFVGLSNFKSLLQNQKFYQAFQNQILLIVLVTIITFAFALVFAYILSREKIKGQGFFRVIFYIPNILSIVVISAIFSAIYKPNTGLLNSIIGIFKHSDDQILWLGDQKVVIYSIVIAMVWQAIGYYMVMYQNNTYILRNQYDQHEFPSRYSNDEWWTGRSFQRIPELYVPGGLYKLFIWIWYGNRCISIPVLLCTCRTAERCNKTSGSRNLRKGESEWKRIHQKNRLALVN